MRNHGNPFDHYIIEIEHKIAEKGVEGLDDRDLQILNVGYQKQTHELLVSPFWTNWKPRDVVVGVLAILIALGVVSSSTASMALKFLGG